MKRLIPTKYRYPVFFLGLLLLSSSGFVYRYVAPPVQFVEAMALLGFALFVASIVA